AMRCCAANPLNCITQQRFSLGWCYQTRSAIRVITYIISVIFAALRGILRSLATVLLQCWHLFNPQDIRSAEIMMKIQKSNPVRHQIMLALSSGMGTEAFPRPDTHEEFQAIVRRLKENQKSLEAKLIIGGFTVSR